MPRRRSTSRISARQAKQAEYKARRNIILAVLMAGILIILFLFVIVPVVFDLAINFAHQGSQTNPFAEDTIAPQKPVFQPPDEYQNEQTIKIEGFTEPAAKLTLEVFSDQQKQEYETVAAEDGSFSFEEKLTEGEYKIKVTAEDKAGNESQSQTHPITIDLTTPTITINSPESGITFSLRSERIAQIEGQASEISSVFLNDSLVFTDEEGVFSTSYSLQEGENKLTFIAEDQAGNRSDPTELTIYYRP